MSYHIQYNTIHKELGLTSLLAARSVGHTLVVVLVANAGAATACPGTSSSTGLTCSIAIEFCKKNE